MLNYITEQPLTEPLVEEFLQAELKAGASPNSVKRYRGDLVQLRRFLGEDAVVRRGTLQAWMQSMQQAGYAPRTVCARIDTANRGSCISLVCRNCASSRRGAPFSRPWP